MDVHFVAPRNSHNGYGTIESYLIRYLKERGIHLQREYTGQKISFIFSPPPAIVNAKGKIKILYCMIEGDTTPPSWIPYMKQADLILVPSKFCQEVFKKDKIETTILPLGYDPTIFIYKKRDFSRPFTVLHYEAFQDRKGWRELLDAWMLSLHTEDTEARLVLKTILPYSQVPEEVKQFSNVEVVCGKLPQHCLVDLLHEAHLFVFPSRGEGFSLPPLEAIATGCPTIITKAHSHLDYFNEEYLWGVSCKKKIKTDYPSWEQVGSFVRCSAEELAHSIEEVYQDYSHALTKSEKALQFIKDYKFENTADKIAEICQQYQRSR